MKNIIKVIILSSGILFSCGGSKKTSQFDESLNNGKISESLIFSATEIKKNISKDITTENKFHYGIANDFEVTKEFFQSVKFKVENKFNK